MNSSPITRAIHFTLRQWPAFVLVILSLPILSALGFCGDVLFHRWHTAVRHELGNMPLPPSAEFLDIQIEPGTLMDVFLSFATLLFLWLLSLLVFATDESRFRLRFLYGFVGIWFSALSFLACVCVAAALPFVSGLRRAHAPPGQFLAPLAGTILHGLLFAVGAVSAFGTIRLAWRHFHA